MEMGIGSKVREARLLKKMSAAEVGRLLSKPITGQAFAQREIKNRFTWDMVVEVAEITSKPLSFLPNRKDKVS